MWNWGMQMRKVNGMHALHGYWTDTNKQARAELNGLKGKSVAGVPYCSNHKQQVKPPTLFSPKR